MESTVTAGIVVATLVALAVVAAYARRRTLQRRASATVTVDTTPEWQQRSAVRILSGDEEVTAALATAAGTERHLLEIASRRYAHYQHDVRPVSRGASAASSRRATARSAGKTSLDRQ